MPLIRSASKKVIGKSNNHKARQKHPTPSRNFTGGGGPMANHPAEDPLHVIGGADLMSVRDRLARARSGFNMKPRRAGGSE